ncbi:MAG: hypothetical protein R6V03_03325 [Kiritimatiellia bacterium]
MLKILNEPCPRVTDTEPSTWLVEWTAEREMPEGTVLELRGENLKTILAAQWHEVSVQGDCWETVWQIPRRSGFADIHADNKEKRLIQARARRTVPEGTVSRFVLRVKPENIRDSDFPVRVVIDGEDSGAADRFSLKTRAGAVTFLRVYVRPSLQADGSLRVVLAPEDGDCFPASFQRPLRVSLRDGKQALWKGHVRGCTAVDIPAKIETGQSPCRLTAAVDRRELTNGEAISNGRREGAESRVVSNPFLTRVSGFIPAFGALHWHTRVSGDGQRTMDAAFLEGRDHGNLDFAAPGDHTPRGRNWRELTDGVEYFNEDGFFTTLYGWELSSNRGHVNFYFVDPDHPMNPENYAGPSLPEEYIESIPHRNFLAIPHHTNAVSKEFKKDGTHYWTEYPWGKPCPEYLRLVEIFQCRGNQERERYPEGWRQQYENNGGSVQTALDSGHRLGFVGGTDDHIGFPGINCHNEGRIVTGAWLKERTRNGLYEALYERRTWACWDTRAIVRFEVNNVLQGGELNACSGTALRARITAHFEAPLDVLELVSNGDNAVAVPYPRDSLDVETEVDLGTRSERTYVYLRVRQTDGAIVYASPVFFTG